MNAPRTGRRPYVRPMNGWWNRDPFFMAYMIREVTAIAVFAYAVVLMMGVLRLSQGEAAFNGWVESLRSVPSLLLHLALLVSMVVHAHSWFVIMPKTMPPIYVNGERLPAATIQRTGWAVSVVATLLVLAAAFWWQS